MGTYWWIVEAARKERVDPNTLDCGIKHLDRDSYWYGRNEAARCVEWLLVTRRWNAEDTYLVSDMDQVVPISCRDYENPPKRARKGVSNAAFRRRSDGDLRFTRVRCPPGRQLEGVRASLRRFVRLDDELRQ